MAHSTRTWTCSVQMGDGRFCDARSAPDMPFPICGGHAFDLFKRMSETLSRAENDFPRLLKLSLDTVDATRKRKETRLDSRKFVVYYVLVGDLLKIGTTGRLRERMHQFPPNRKLLAYERGSYELERERHRQFSDLLDCGNEWFRFEGDLVTHVQNLRDQAA